MFVLTLIDKEAFNGNKISVIKAIRTLFGLGLKEAKDITEQFPAVKSVRIEENMIANDFTKLDAMNTLKFSGMMLERTSKVGVEKHLAELKKMAIASIEIGDDDVAVDILNFCKTLQQKYM